MLTNTKKVKLNQWPPEIKKLMNYFKSNYYRDRYSDNLEFILSLVAIAACLILAAVFPVQGGFQQITKDLFFLVLLPVLFIKYILKKNLQDFGLNMQNQKIGFIGALFMFLLAALTSLLFLRYNIFRENYVLPGQIVNNFGYFLLYEFLFVNLYLFVYEFFLRGFVLFTLAPKIKAWAIPVQLIVYLAPSTLTGQLSWGALPAIIVAALGGTLAYRTRSIFYSYLAAFFLTLMLNAYLIHTVK